MNIKFIDKTYVPCLYTYFIHSGRSYPETSNVIRGNISNTFSVCVITREEFTFFKKARAYFSGEHLPIDYVIPCSSISNVSISLKAIVDRTSIDNQVLSIHITFNDTGKTSIKKIYCKDFTIIPILKQLCTYHDILFTDMLHLEKWNSLDQNEINKKVYKQYY